MSDDKDMKKAVKSWGVDPKKYPCVHIAYFVNYSCDEHDDAWECPDKLIVCKKKGKRFGLPLRDGGRSYVEISFCPWCGTRLRKAK